MTRIIPALVSTLLAIMPLDKACSQSLADSALSGRLDGLAAGLMVTEQVPGAIAAVVVGDEVLLRGWGYADLEAGIRAGPEDVRFEIGSITKLFTWIAVMVLVEEGRLELSADIEKYLREAEVPGTEPLTLAQLMSHRPGYEDTYTLFDPAIGALPRPQALAASAPAQVFPRGALTAYSNWGVALAGQVVEDVSGMPYEEFLETRILGPLGMRSTTYSEAGRRPQQPPLSRSYRVHGGIEHPAFRLDIGSFGPAGSLASTAADMARFLRFLLGDGSLDGERLLQPETMARMRGRLFDDRPQAADIAHGFQSRPMFGTYVYGHAGGLNEFLSNLVFLPELSAGVFVSQNGGTGASLPFLAPDMVLAALAEQAGLADTAPQRLPEASTPAAEVAGRYLNNRRVFSGPAQLLAALSPLTVTVLPDGALLVPNSMLQRVSRFESIGPDLWESPLGGRLWLIRDADGRVVRLADETGVHTYERVQGPDDPLWLGVSLALATLLAFTTLLGLLWRRGLRGGSALGTAAAASALAAAAAQWLMIGAAVATGLVAARLGAQFLFDQPQLSLTALLVAADVLVVLAAIMVASIGLIWRAPGWSLGRRLHHGAFALALAGLAFLLLRWDLAFGGSF